jgi:hypothetical protein
VARLQLLGMAGRRRVDHEGYPRRICRRSGSGGPGGHKRSGHRGAWLHGKVALPEVSWRLGTNYAPERRCQLPWAKGMRSRTNGSPCTKRHGHRPYPGRCGHRWPGAALTRPKLPTQFRQMLTLIAGLGLTPTPDSTFSDGLPLWPAQPGRACRATQATIAQQPLRGSFQKAQFLRHLRLAIPHDAEAWQRKFHMRLLTRRGLEHKRDQRRAKQGCPELQSTCPFPTAGILPRRVPWQGDR